MIGLTFLKGWRIATAILLTLSMVFSLFPVNYALAADMPHQVTNVGDRAFTVTWVTSTEEEGYVNYGTSAESLTPDYDDRGQATSDDTHHVTISSLSAGTTYYYEIVSDGVTYNNNGAPYEITTGPVLDFMMPEEMITGKVYKADGATAAEGAIVYARIGASQVLSALVDSNGYWGLNIAPIRAADYKTYYAHSDSNDINIEAQGAADGMTIQTVTVATAKTGALAVELTSDLTADSNTDESVRSSDVAKEALPEEAAFTTSNLAISPAEVDIGNFVTISVVATNTGGREGTYAVELKIDDAVIDAKDVTLADGASKTVTFTTSKDTAGTYNVSIAGLSGVFMVKPALSPVPAPPPALSPVPAPPPAPSPSPAPPPSPVPSPASEGAEINFWLIGGIAASVMIALAVTIWLKNKRRYQDTASSGKLQ